MAIAQLGNVSAGDIISAQPCVIRTKRLWSDAWTTMQYLEAVNAVATVAPQMSRATLRYHYGAIMRERNTSFSRDYPMELYNRYVEINVIRNAKRVTIWTGIILGPVYDIWGVETGAAPGGSQHFACHGLEHILNTEPIRGCYADRGGETVQLNVGLQFNKRHRIGGSLKGNKISGSSLFGGEAVWSTYDILEYLNKNYMPSSPAFQWDWDNDIDALLQEIEPVINLEGLTIFAALNKLIDRRRGLGWTIRLADGTPRIKIFSTSAETVTAGNATVPGNLEQIRIQVDDSFDVDSCKVKPIEEARFDKIIVQGAPIKTCFSVSYADSTLEAAWASAEETAYLAGASGTADENDRVRLDERYARVFQRFRIPKTFDWLVGDGVGGSKTNALPSAQLDGSFDTETAAEYLNVYKFINDWLPLREGFDYTSDILNPTDRNPSDSDPQFLQMLVLLKNTSDNKWHYAERHGPDLGMSSYADVSPLDREFSLEVKTNPNHQLALNHWGGANVSNLTPAAGSQVDWQDIIATIFLDTDERPRITLDMSDAYGGEVTKSLLITIADCECWYIAENTVCGIDSSGALAYVSGAGWLRDDSAWLQTVAAMAKAWYGQRRATMKLTLTGVQDLVELGAIVARVTANWTEQEVKTVITRKEWTFGTKDRAGRTVIETAYSGLDFASLGGPTRPKAGGG